MRISYQSEPTKSQHGGDDVYQGVHDDPEPLNAVNNPDQPENS